MAEFVVAGLLHFMRGIDVAVEQQRRSEWSKAFFVADDSPLRELGDSRVLIVGTGGIGQATATRLAAFGATCIGVRRRPELGPPPGFSAVVGPTALDDELVEGGRAGAGGAAHTGDRAADDRATGSSSFRAERSW